MKKEYGENQIMTNFIPTDLHHQKMGEEEINQQFDMVSMLTHIIIRGSSNVY